jgi:hypothetical protein
MHDFNLKIPRFFPRTNPTPPDESNATGQVFFDSRMIPTPPDESDYMHPSFNPKVPGSRPGRPTSLTGPPGVPERWRLTIAKKTHALPHGGTDVRGRLNRRCAMLIERRRNNSIQIGS